jgi:protein-arginine kinase activator protein McsA
MYKFGIDRYEDPNGYKPDLAPVCPECGETTQLLYVGKHHNCFGCGECVQEIWFDDDVFGDETLDVCPECGEVADLYFGFIYGNGKKVEIHGCEYCVDRVTEYYSDKVRGLTYDYAG